MTTVINVEHISKKYLISHQAKRRFYTLREQLTDFVSHLNQPANHHTQEEFWALNDVSFSIAQGQRVGIIGSNGSGKSTLLKILSRITPPTMGRASIRGRLCSLLEVGTGFHPELTGRENIFLNGSILGMRRAEIRKKFDAIVSFAEIDKFLDTPVKRYSSGMYVRLAFAVAAHLQPDILIIDEVLAVGDMDFQKKCLAKIKSAENEGTTILMVSHNLSLIKDLCPTTILLSEGRISSYHHTEEVVGEYAHLKKSLTSITLRERKDRNGNGDIKFESITFHNKNGLEIKSAFTDDYLSIHVNLQAHQLSILEKAIFSLTFVNEADEKVCCLYNKITIEKMELSKSGFYQLKFDIESLSLLTGEYQINLYASLNNQLADHVLSSSTITVSSDTLVSQGKIGGEGLFYLPHKFTLLKN